MADFDDFFFFHEFKICQTIVLKFQLLILKKHS